MKRLFLIFLLCVLFAAVILFWPGSNRDLTQIDVHHGSTAHSVLDQLRNHGVLKARLPFLVWTKVRGGDRIKVGRYLFKERRSAYWILDDLIRGRTHKIKVVIPEGFASWQIAERLESRQICPAAPFLALIQEKGWEGSLYPATYELDLGLDPTIVAHYLKAEFDKRWTPDLDRRAAEIGWTKNQTITFASILEREIKVRDELPLVSSLYHNRLRRNMKLEADPTVQYAMGYWKSRLLKWDYHNTISPYNTYLHKGFPPGPICSPGMDAIRAALWPQKSDYLYMVANEDGYHDFSKTYREHVNKVNRRNRLRRQKRLNG